jgi:hypothetical protein
MVHDVSKDRTTFIFRVMQSKMTSRAAEVLLGHSGFGEQMAGNCGEPVRGTIETRFAPVHE